MLIGELSNRSGLSRDTIRFYEKEGYIKVGRRERRVNNYKEYSEATLKRLLLFNKIKSYGFTLNESAEIISLLESNLGTCNQISKAADRKIEVIDKKIQELLTLKTLLRTTINNCKSGCCSPSYDENCPLFVLD
ncbi:MAG: MerR family transcriptional regulator [Chitinophagaceae bacterium]|nr:MerR family transcriptional regulator [Chitinophagaceae bacterium]